MGGTIPGEDILFIGRKFCVSFFFFQAMTGFVDLEFEIEEVCVCHCFSPAKQDVLSSWYSQQREITKLSVSLPLYLYIYDVMAT